MASKAGSIRAGGAYVELYADRGPLDKGLREAQEKVKGFGKTVGAIGAALGAAGIAIATPIVLATKRFADTGTELILMSKRTGWSVQALSKLGYAATETGTDLETVERSIKKLQRTIIEAGFGSNEAALHFAALGLSVQYLLRLSPEKQFEAVAAAIARLRDPTQRAGIALMLFGRTGTVLLPLIENMRELNKQAEEYGLVVSPEMAQAGYELQKALRLLSLVLDYIGKTIAYVLQPAITEYVIAFAKMAKQVTDYIKANKEVVFTVLKIAAGLIAAGGALIAFAAAARVANVVLNVLRIAIAAVHTTLILLRSAVVALHFVMEFTSSLAALKAVLMALASPMGVFIIALGAAAAALIYFVNGAKILDWIKKQFADLYKDATASLTGIANAVKAGDLRLAFKILWLGIKATWLEGMNFITQNWLDFKGMFSAITNRMADLFEKSWINISAAAQTAMIEIEDSVNSGVEKMLKAWNKGLSLARLAFMVFSDFIQTAWENMTIAVPGPIADAIEIMRKNLLHINTLFFGGVADMEEHGKMMLQIEQESDAMRKGGPSPESIAAQKKRQNEILKESVQAFGGMGVGAIVGAMIPPALPNPRLAEIEQKRIAALQRVNDLQKVIDDQRGKATDAAKKAAQEELEIAKVKLRFAINQARIEAKNIKKRKEEPFTGPGEFNLGEIRKVKIDIAGGFNAMALRGLGAGSSVQDEQLAAQKQMVILLNEIARRKDRFATLFD